MAVVSIDDDFARFGAKSYAINKINSVEVRERKPHSEGAAVLLAVLAVIILISAAGESSAGSSGIAGFLFGAMVGAIAYWRWQRAKIREYLLFLMTSSSETQAFVTKDENEVDSLRGQIESAMTRHSQGGIRG